jgi:hypothetical protein
MFTFGSDILVRRHGDHGGGWRILRLPLVSESGAASFAGARGQALATELEAMTRRLQDGGSQQFKYQAIITCQMTQPSSTTSLLITGTRTSGRASWCVITYRGSATPWPHRSWSIASRRVGLSAV